MKAKGSANDADAQHAQANCIHYKEVGLLELVTPEVRTGGQVKPDVI